jgi:hypothetical protein
MNICNLIKILGIGVCLFSCWVSGIPALHDQCRIQRLELSPPYLVAWGDDLIVHSSGQCRASTPHLTLSANAVIIAETDDTELWAVIHTATYPFGRLDVCASIVPATIAVPSLTKTVCTTVWLVDQNSLSPTS